MALRSISERLLVVSLLFTFCDAFQAQRFSFQRYGETQGLTNLVITDLIQDKQGYIWAATFNGLFRYDGTSFERFGEKEGIVTTGSIYLTKTPSGDLWAVSDHALFAWTENISTSTTCRYIFLTDRKPLFGMRNYRSSSLQPTRDSPPHPSGAASSHRRSSIH
jgi:ligand-binding sensor domain-containing protein